MRPDHAVHINVKGCRFRLGKAIPTDCSHHVSIPREDFFPSPTSTAKNEPFWMKGRVSTTTRKMEAIMKGRLTSLTSLLCFSQRPTGWEASMLVAGVAGALRGQEHVEQVEEGDGCYPSRFPKKVKRGFPYMEVPQKWMICDGIQWKILLIWMIWGYPDFRTSPNMYNHVRRASFGCQPKCFKPFPMLLDL